MMTEITRGRTLRTAILGQMVAIAEQQSRPLAPLDDELPLMQSGLDSLCIALLVAKLEDQFGLDPFAADEAINFPVTVGDFIALYESVVG